MRIVRLEPVPEGSAQHACVRARRSALHHEMFSIEKIGRIARIERKGLEPGQGPELCRSPLPSVANQVEHAIRARARGMCVNRGGIPAFVMEIAARWTRRSFAPWI